MRQLNRRLAAASGALFAGAAPVFAAPPGTTFTYQGKLELNGAAVENPSPGCDFAFSLWNNASAGNQIGSPQTLTNVPVNNGLFTVNLNTGGEFGPDAFDGDERFLEIAVACPSGGPLQPLSPRQEVMPAPYALFALHGPGGGNGYWAITGDDVHNSNNGNVGIGTTSPTRLLDVNGTATIGGSLFFDTPGILEVAHDNNTGMRINPIANSVHLEADNLVGLTLIASGDVGVGTSSPANRLTVDGKADFTGSVGVGTATPDTELHVFGADPLSAFDEHLRMEGADTSGAGMTGAGISFTGHDGQIRRHWAHIRGLKANSIVANTDSVLTFWTRQHGGENLRETMRLNEDGNLGVGTTVPTSKLTVDGTVESQSGGFVFPDGTVQATAVSGVSGDFSLPYSGTTVAASTAFSVTNDGNGRAAYFESTSDGEAIRANSFTNDSAITGINSGTGGAAFFQNFGAGNTVTVSSFADGSALNVIQLGNGGPAGQFEINDTQSGEPAIRARVTNGSGYALDAEGKIRAEELEITDGNVGIGTTSPAPGFRLDVIGEIRCMALTETSSRSLKENIAPIEGALEKVGRLQGVRFNWTAEHGGQPDLGFVVEEVAEVLPELVTWDEDGIKVSGLKYSHVTAVAVEAIKELRAEVASKEIEIAEQRAAISRMRHENTALAARLQRIETIIAAGMLLTERSERHD